MTVKPNIRGVHFLFILLAAQAGAAECIAIEGPVVRASMLAPFIDPAATPQSDPILTSTPDPGTRRWITSVEMHRWGLSPRESLATPGVCIERRLHSLQSEDVMRELQGVLQQGHGKVQNVGITSIQPLLVPEGRLRLPPAGFQELSTNNGFCSFLWRGSVEFDSHRLIAIKLLGRYQAETFRFVATRNLQPGEVLSASDYQRITEPGCSSGATELALSEGFIMRQTLSEGDDIKTAMLKAPPVVEEGAAVRVMASTGGALVSIDAIAEAPGRRGDTVFVRNRESGKRIRVLLTGKGEARAVVAGTTR